MSFMDFRLRLKSGTVVRGRFMQTLFGYSNVDTGFSYAYDDVEEVLPLERRDLLKAELMEWAEISSKLVLFLMHCSEENKAYIKGELEAWLDFLKEKK